MPTHDVIDNRNEKLVDHILSILPSAQKAKFAVGYFFLSGFEALNSSLDEIEELRLLIGNTSNRQTIEQLAEGYRHLELVRKEQEKLQYTKRTNRQKRKKQTAGNIRDAVGVMDQTDEGEKLIHSLRKMIEEERLKVKVYTRGRLHAKAYIFDYSNPNPGNDGIAIVGSSNLSLAGIQDNTELNVLVHDNGNPQLPGKGNHGKLTEWFDELWGESEDFAAELMHELNESWAAKPASPYDVFMKSAYTLVKDRLDGDEGDTLLWDGAIKRDLANFQKQAVSTALGMIRQYGGCFVSDVVGLGKSYVGSAIVKHFRITEGARPLIICPKSLVEMWEGYNERYELDARVLPMSLLQSGERGVDIGSDERYRNRDFVLIDESHTFRHHSTQKYEELSNFLGRGQRVCLLTATPRNTRVWDVYNQIKLFHPDEITNLPIDPPHLRDYFKLIEKGERKLEDLLVHVIVRRRRRDILRWYGYAQDTGEELSGMSDVEVAPYLGGEKLAYIRVGGEHQRFPQRELETLRYSIEDTYDGLYQEIRNYLGKPAGKGEVRPGEMLTYARYGLWHYLDPKYRERKPYSDLQRAGINLRGLIRTMLFKRFESSVCAFRETVRRMISTHELFVESLKRGLVPAGDEAEGLLGRAGRMDDEELLDGLDDVSGRYDIEAFNKEKLQEHVHADIGLLKKILDMVEPIKADEDDKLQVLMNRLSKAPINGGKCLIFTQYADTAEYLYDNLNPGGSHRDIEVISGGGKSKARVAGRFAPKANPEFSPKDKSKEIRILVATDVMSQGLNLQDCDVAINYDLHWNPVRLIQRFGRIDRIGSTHETVWGMNFLPETGLERNLGIKEALSARIQEIHNTIGEDAQVLDKNERLNEKAMFAIYEEKTGQLSLFDEPGEQGPIGLNEIEERLRALRERDSEEFERIANLRDGIRSSMVGAKGDLFVHCRSGKFQRLFLLDKDDEVIQSEPSEVLGAIWASRDYQMIEPSIPPDHNKRVMRVKERFAEDVKHRQAQQEYSSSLLVCQRYVVRELKELYRREEDEDIRSQINVLDQAFRQPVTVPVRKRLDRVKRNEMTGQPLLQELIRIYHDYRLDERQAAEEMESNEQELTRIVCSEALSERKRPECLRPYRGKGRIGQ